MTLTTQQEFFVIQRCWFSGPHHEPPVDCRRLFVSRREAEEVAYHSAHSFANHSIFNNGGSICGMTRQTLNATVKTILLPPSASGTAGQANYAFQACGKLFWVRPVLATIVPEIAASVAAGITYPPSTCANGATTFSSAEVVMTENVIGGTGNPSSRRGVEVHQGRVFVSRDLANANRWAVETATHHQRDIWRFNPHVKVTVLSSVPIGASQHNFALDWPVSVKRVAPRTPTGAMQWAPVTDTGSGMMDEEGGKREFAVVVPDPFAKDPRRNANLPSKRQCFRGPEGVVAVSTQAEHGVSCGMTF